MSCPWGWRSRAHPGSPLQLLFACLMSELEERESHLTARARVTSLRRFWLSTVRYRP